MEAGGEVCSAQITARTRIEARPRPPRLVSYNCGGALLLERGRGVYRYSPLTPPTSTTTHRPTTSTRRTCTTTRPSLISPAGPRSLRSCPTNLLQILALEIRRVVGAVPMV